MGILQWTKRFLVRAICGLHLKDRKRAKDLILVLGLSKTIDQLAMTNSVRWHGHVLRREVGHILKWALEIEVEGQRKKRRPKRT